MSKIKCPRCNKPDLFLKIDYTYTFSIKEVGTEDVIPEEKLDEDSVKYMYCMTCGWTGWGDDYWETKEGLVHLFPGTRSDPNENMD
jgi:hypothetical protein